MLAEGPGGTAHLRVPAGLPGGLFHVHRAPVPARREPIGRGCRARLPSQLGSWAGWPLTRGLACLRLPAFRGIARDEAPPASVAGRGLGPPWGRGLRLPVTVSGLRPPTRPLPAFSPGALRLSGGPWEERLGLRVPFS